LEKKGVLDRFKRLSKPTGSPQWGHAVRAVILMVLAGLTAQFLGFDNGIQAVMVITLLASIIIDTALPIRKVAILALVGLFMTTLAFISASLALTSIEIFILFTVLWAFFSSSMYIFGTTEGSLGFTFFLIYFIAVLLVNSGSTTLDWATYSILSYLVVSILFIPKIWLEKKRIREMVTIGFIPGASIQNVISTRNILSGIPLNKNYFDIFKLGSFLKGSRSYSNLISSRLNSKSQVYFKNFLDTSDRSSFKLANHFKSNKGSIDLKEVDDQLSNVKSHFLENKEYSKVVIEISQNITDILHKSNKILARNPGKETNKIESSKRSLKDVLGANFNLNNLYIRHAVRFTLAITIGLIFVYLTRERSVIWITMGILIILKPDITSTFDNLISRVGFNLFAIILAILLSFIFPHQLLMWLAFIMLFLFRAFYPHYMGFSIIAITVFIVLIWPTGTVFDNAIARLVDIALGGIIAFICAYLILPSRVTINLPDQLSRTIEANIKYANHIVTSKGYNHKKALECFKNYILEENNLEAATKKLEDSFNDVNDDLALYQEIIDSNNKMAADLTAVAAILESNPGKLVDNTRIRNALNELENVLKGYIKPQKLAEDDISMDYTNKDLDQLLNWIIIDIQLIIRGMEIAAETGALMRYTKI
jgi:hypothetical protein